jgi:hypothetical protein
MSASFDPLDQVEYPEQGKVKNLELTALFFYDKAQAFSGIFPQPALSYRLLNY